MVINRGLLIIKGKRSYNYSVIRLYIADYFIRLYSLITVNCKDDDTKNITKTKIKRLII
jgi:hypothetical protein